MFIYIFFWKKLFGKLIRKFLSPRKQKCDIMLFAAVGGNSPQKSKIVRAPITSLIHKLEPNDICVDPFPGLLVRLKCICGLSLHIHTPPLPSCSRPWDSNLGPQGLRSTL